MDLICHARNTGTELISSDPVRDQKPHKCIYCKFLYEIVVYTIIIFLGKTSAHAYRFVRLITYVFKAACLFFSTSFRNKLVSCIKCCHFTKNELKYL
jgi:hypothetical protein